MYIFNIFINPMSISFIITGITSIFTENSEFTEKHKE